MQVLTPRFRFATLATTLVAASLAPSTARAQSTVQTSAPDDNDDDEDLPATASSDRETPPRTPPVERIRPYQAPYNAAWIEPLWPVIGAFAGAPSTNIGFSHSLSRGVDLTLSGGFGYISQQNVGSGGVSAGLTFFLTGIEPMNGLFLTTKLAFNIGSNGSYGSTSAFIGPGLDMGYQFTYGGFFIAPVIGLEWDVAIPVTNSSASPAYVTRLNLAGFRIGWTFDGASGSRGERRRGIRVASHQRRGVDLAHDTRPRTFAVWTTPVWMGIGPLFNRYNLELGATLRVSDRVQIALEGTYEWGAIRNNSSGMQANYARADMAIGVPIMLYTSGGLTGLFLEPKVYGNAWIPGAFGGLAPAIGAGFGIDIGYNFTAGPLYIAPVFGIRLGGIALAQPGVLPEQQPNGFYPEVNLTVMRMGLAF